MGTPRGYKKTEILVVSAHFFTASTHTMASRVLTLLVATLCAFLVVDINANAPDSCFGSLGCFSNGAPWTTLLRPIPPPRSPEFIDTQYFLYTRNAPVKFTVAHPADGVYSVSGSDFDGNRPTIFIFHGFTQNSNRTTIMALKDAVVAKSDANVIVVDWGNGSKDPGGYFNVVANTRVVAAATIQFLKYLIAEKSVSVAKVHLIGFSLGAHISGYVGKAIPNIGRISALDAAQPGFEGFDKAVRLDLSDAVFIDAIHTNGRPTIPFGGFGYVGPVGHVDFFVNGGWNQPGCARGLIPNVTKLADIGAAELTAIASFIKCPHDRALLLFTASLAEPNCRFWGRRANFWQRALSVVTWELSSFLWPLNCDKSSCSEMGFDSIHFPGRGSFEVVTSETPPFCNPDAKANAAMAPFFMA